MRRTRVAGLVCVGTLAVGVVVFQTIGGRRLLRRLARVTRAVTSKARYEAGRLEGFRYRVEGRHPDPSASDGVLADRVRSVLGPLEHRLDIPRVHVLAEGHLVHLHGSVASDEHVTELVHAVRSVPGVDRVSSHLHVGLAPSDTRPSEGQRHHPPSAALLNVLAAARGGGAPAGSERAVARSVLSTLASVLPPGERRHVLGHLPTDVRELAEPVRPGWARHRHPRRVADFTRAALPGFEPAVGQAVVESVVGAVRGLVPEEDTDVAAVLPFELRHLWKTAIAQ
jgi:uncharacterized protein (DUF2267 family)